MTRILTTNTYQKLVTKIRKEIGELEILIKRQTVKSYWNVGKYISEHLLESGERAEYGEKLFRRLASDLVVDQRTLEKCVKFYRVFKIADTCPQLTWSHYRVLITIEDSKKRLYYQKQAVRQAWSVEELSEAIRLYKLQLRDLRGAPSQEPAARLSLTRGELYTYRLIRPDNIKPEEAELLVDCGFNFWRDLPLKGLSSPQEKDIVSVSKSESGYRFSPSEASRRQLYTFKALIERVIDADTMRVHIDLGFSNWSRQSIRFRGIDAPEVSTKKGIRAKEFVEAKLAPVEFVIIKTYSPDKYDRYLGDIFYLQGENDPQVILQAGVFLNQELLDQGLAKIM